MTKGKEQFNRGEIAIYKPKSGLVELKVSIENETIWLSLIQIAELFNIDKSGISRHIKNIFESNELDKDSTVAKIATVQIEGGREIKRDIEYYNLDVIISVGYRVNSQKATQFRIWATNTLKEYLVKGYVVNKERILETKEKFNKLQQMVSFLKEKAGKKMLEGQEGEILSLLANYSKTLTLLEKYDEGKLKKAKGIKTDFVLKYEDSLKVVTELKKDLVSKKEASDMFGKEREKALEGIIKNLYQTFGGKELYKSIEEKASHVLYLIIKDHPFSDGNKRIGSFMFIYFMDRCNYLYQENGEKKINDNALTALALLIAESDPKEKDQMIALITQLIK
jgi:prophage maintenance system killer protein